MKISLPQVGKVVIVAPRDKFSDAFARVCEGGKWRIFALFYKLRPPKEGQVGRLPAPWRHRSPETGGKNALAQDEIIDAPRLVRKGGTGAGRPCCGIAARRETNAAPMEPGASVNDAPGL